MIGLQRVKLEGKRFVILEESEYERLCREARESPPEDELPELPKPDRKGRFPAVAFARVALARDLIRDRKGLGWSQHQLARLAGVRQETISRLESGKHTASSRTIDKICKALEKGQRAKNSRKNGRNPT
jgi:DNA-binding XRE family transcriptional regulator